MKKVVGGRKKNTPLCLFNRPNGFERTISTSNEKTHRFVENMMIIWLDGTLEKPNESSLKSLGQFRRVINIVQTFTDLETCFNFVSTVKDEKIFFVVSGSLGPQIVPRIDAFNQIHSIYIFCGNKANHETMDKTIYKKSKVFIHV